jgi:undecaprenyl-diphosphatase
MLHSVNLDLRRRLARVGRADTALMRRSARLPAGPADDALRAVSRAADRGLLWFAMAGAFALRKGKLRRAGLRGAVAVAGASFFANVITKPLFPRRRPAAALLPARRRLRRRPTSSSFPSGHSASAAAFVTAAAMESPLAGAVAVPLAAAVAYSRVHTGVHWPSDVAAGVLIGGAVAAATRHWWPLHPSEPARSEHPADAPVMPDGVDMVALVNPKSGDDGDDPTALTRVAWPLATFVQPEQGRDIVEQLQQLIDERAAQGRPVRALAVAGGDGTVAAVASVAAENKLPLVLIPAGTLNHFARDVGVQSVRDADEATEAGTAIGVDLGEVTTFGDDGTSRRWFLNTAGIGGYPEMVRLREVLEKHYPKWIAGVIAMVRTLRHASPIRVLLNGQEHLVWMIFVGNGSYHPKGFAPSSRPAMDSGKLDVRYLRADVPYSRARFVLASITNTLATSHVYRQYDLPELEVRLLDGNRRVATDGEVGPLGNRFVFRSRSDALTVYR